MKGRPQATFGTDADMQDILSFGLKWDNRDSTYQQIFLSILHAQVKTVPNHQ